MGEEKNTQSGVAMDAEWVCLIAIAKELGISKDEVREFLSQSVATPFTV